MVCQPRHAVAAVITCWRCACSDSQVCVKHPTMLSCYAASLSTSTCMLQEAAAAALGTCQRSAALVRDERACEATGRARLLRRGYAVPRPAGLPFGPVC